MLANLPWAHPERPFTPDDFGRDRIVDLAAQIADFAIEHEVDAVFAPTRLLDGPQDAWLDVDAATCEALRYALDVRGANAIAMDYPLLTNYQVLLDGSARNALASRLIDLPFEYLWFRIANFGSDKSAAGVRKYVNAVRDFHEIERPVIADGVGGLPALGILSFGATGGICHGVAEKERFYPNYWRRPQKSGGGGRSSRRVYFANLDMYLSDEQASTLLATRSAKPLLGCRGTGCCPGGWEDMILNPKTHYLVQTTHRVCELGGIPDLRRADHFLAKQLAPSDRVARNAVRLRVPDQKILKRLAENSRKIDDMRRVFEDLHITDHNLSRSRAPVKRTRRSNAGSITRGG